MHIVLDISNIHVVICHCRKAADKSAPARQASPPKGPSPRRRPTPPRSPSRRLASPDSEEDWSRQRSLQEVRPAKFLPRFTVRTLLCCGYCLWQMIEVDKSIADHVYRGAGGAVDAE